MYIADLQINTHQKPSLKTQNCAFKKLGSLKAQPHTRISKGFFSGGAKLPKGPLSLPSPQDSMRSPPEV